MGNINQHRITRDVTSSAANNVSSNPLRVAGQAFSFQSVAPAALVQIEGSNDGVTWTILTDLENVALSTLQSVQEEVKERPEFVRFTVVTDAGGPQLYRVLFAIRKRDS